VTLDSELEALVADARQHGHSMVDCRSLERLLHKHDRKREIFRPDLIKETPDVRL
jgi:hypothetical protein